MRLDPRVRIAVSLSLEGDPSLKRDKRPAEAQIKGGSEGTGQRATVKRRRQGNTVERCRRCGWTCHTHPVYPLPQNWSRSRTVFVAALGAASSRKARSRPPHPGPLRSLLVDPLRARQAEPALPSQVLRAARPRLAGAKRTPVPIQRRQSRVPSFSASSSSSSPGLNLVSAVPSPTRVRFVAGMTKQVLNSPRSRSRRSRPRALCSVSYLLSELQHVCSVNLNPAW